MPRAAHQREQDDCSGGRGGGDAEEKVDHDSEVEKEEQHQHARSEHDKSQRMSNSELQGLLIGGGWFK